MAEKRVKYGAAKDDTDSGTGKDKKFFGQYTLSDFSEEVLERIFFQLSEPRDLLGISNATPQFRRILQPKIPVWSFGEVFPLIFSKIDKDDIFNCRLVCKDWNVVVDNFLQTHPVTRALEPYPYHPTKKLDDNKIPSKNAPPAPPSYTLQYMPSLLNKGIDGVGFSDSESIERFLEKTKNHPRNPVVLRFLDFSNSLWDDEDPQAYWKNVETLLTRVGHDITQVHLAPNDDDEERDVVFICYKIIRNCLLKLPNLRVLTISGFDCHSCYHAADARKVGELQRYVEENPLPELPFLETLETTVPVNFRTDTVLEELMTRYSAQLKKAFISLSMWTEEENSMFRFSNLTELQLGVDNEFPELQKFIRKIQVPNVKKLHLVFHDRLRIFPVLESFHNYFPSLEYLKLRFNTRPDDYSSEAPPKFCFKNIKTFEVVDNPNVPYGVMFRHLTNLEYVLITADQGNRGPPRKASIFRNQLYTGGIYKSFIWTFLKYLKEFTFAWLGNEDEMIEIVSKKVYTRARYEYLKKKEETKSDDTDKTVTDKQVVRSQEE